VEPRTLFLRPAATCLAGFLDGTQWPVESSKGTRCADGTFSGVVAMLQIIEDNRAELERLCRRFHVRRLDLFGSGATVGFEPETSDLDFLVEFEADAPQKALDGYLDLKAALERLLSRQVDLVVDSAVVNPYFRASIERSRTPLYAA
jgi:predicted nucleotidyltransferase